MFCFESKFNAAFHPLALPSNPSFLAVSLGSKFEFPLEKELEILQAKN
jgi:hypothetical protein